MSKKVPKKIIDEKNVVDSELSKIHKQQEQQNLFAETEAQIPIKSFDKEAEIYQLRNGFEFSIKLIKATVNDFAGDYAPMFPNSNPFFTLMYGLLKWDHLDPNSFIKPPVVAYYIKRYIYSRFTPEVLPALLDRPNPVITGYIKKYKLFQFLSPTDLIKLEGIIQDAIDVMRISDNFYDFELKYTKLYKLSVQLKMDFK